MPSCRWLFPFFSALLLSGCGYHWGLEYPEGRRPTVVVPFVAGDEDGTLTQHLIAALNDSGLVDVKNKSGDYVLKVSIAQAQNETIGYRRDLQKIRSKIRNNLLAIEERRTLEADVTLFKGGSEEIAAGPYRIASDVDYDYVDGDSYQQLTFSNQEGKTVVVLPFSLGQLEPQESAQEGSTKSLYRKISQKIVDAISAEW